MTVLSSGAKGKRTPFIPAATTQNGRESATDVRYMPGRDRQSEVREPHNMAYLPTRRP